jgi:PAS domain S-box-containing protein
MSQLPDNTNNPSTPAVDAAASATETWTQLGSPLAHRRRKTDAWFDLLIDAIHDGACILDAEGRIVFANEQLIAILHCTRQDLIGSYPTVFIEEFSQLLPRLMQSGVELMEWTAYQTQLIRMGGTRTAARMSLRALRDPAGNFRGGLIVISDLTEYQRHENTIATLRAAIDQNPVGVVITNREGHIEYVNQQLCEQSGYTADDLLGQTPRIMNSGLTPSETIRQLWEALNAEQAWKGTLIDRKKDGDLYWVHEVVFPLRTATGDITHYAAYQEDISGLVAAEQALKNSEHKYSSLVNSALVGIFIVQNERLVFCNPKLAQIFEYTVESLLEIPVSQLLETPNIGEQDDLGSQGDRETHKQFEYVTKGYKRTGGPLFCHVVTTPTEFDGKGARLGNLMDVTNEIQLVQQMVQSAEELKALTAQLLTVEEKERQRIARELHDSIGQHLNAIKIGLLQAQSGVDNPPGQTGTGAYRPLVALVEETMAEVRRISLDLRPPILDDLGIAMTITWFCRRLQEQHPAKRVRVLVGKSDLVPEYLKITLFRILQEATSNIIKYAAADEITVQLRVSESLIEFTVTDNGCGFEVPARMTINPDGTGFGLISMRERVNLSGGKFKIQSAPDCGTTLCACWVLR